MNTNFIKELIAPKNNKEQSFWFIFQGDNILVCSPNTDKCSIPLVKDPGELNITPLRAQYLGRYGNHCCYSAEVAKKTVLPSGMFFYKLIGLFGLMDHKMFEIAGYAFQIMRWDQTFQYCGRCGAKTKNLENERGKICEKCQLINYPRISPAVIAAVVKENKILLAKANRFKRNMYSVLAGFVEAGETLEECVKREVKEEVNIELENIKYFGSQPWPFPDSLMVGFTADYKSGELSVDNNEIADAGWFTPENLPNIPGKFSIARELIDWFIEKYS